MQCSCFSLLLQIESLLQSEINYELKVIQKSVGDMNTAQYNITF